MLLFLSADSPEPKGRKAVVMLTLRKLKEMVESPKKGEKKPSCKSLREGKCPVVAQKIIQNEVGVITITVYKNGYVVYQAQNRVTVFPIGDDINDLSCMIPVKEAGGVVGCPADAVERVKEISDFVALHNGGDGAVRDFIEWIIKE